jgi:hypothetical protein
MFFAMASLACRPPEYRVLSQSPQIVDVAVKVTAHADDALDLEREFAAAIRARLSSYATVVPEGVAPPEGALRLNIEIDNMSRKKVDAAAVGAGAAVAVGTAHVITRRRGYRGRGGNDFFAALDAIMFGLDVAANIEAKQQYRAALLGFVPPRISGLMTLGRLGDGERTIFAEGIRSGTVTDALSPISAVGDQAAVDAEVARALAKVIVAKLRAAFDWRASAVPSWYEPPDPLA